MIEMVNELKLIVVHFWRSYPMYICGFTVRKSIYWKSELGRREPALSKIRQALSNSNSPVHVGHSSVVQ